jgi:hypothetical protein
MKNLIIAFCTWKRHELTDIVVKHYVSMGCKVVIADSEGREFEGALKVIQTPNHPLTDKFNALFKACEEFNPDGVVLIGSDDLLSAEVIQWYKDNCKRGNRNLVGFKEIYFYSTKTKDAAYFEYKKELTLGGGRFYSNWVLKKCGFEPWNSTRQTSGLDANSKAKLTSLGIGEKVEKHNGVFLGVKSGENITNEAIINGLEKVETSIFKNAFGETWEKVAALERKEPEIVKITSTHATIITTSRNKYHGAGKELTTDANTAEILIKKGFAYLK